MTQKFPILALTPEEIKEQGFRPVCSLSMNPELNHGGPMPDNPTSTFDAMVKFKSDNVENVSVTVDVPNREYEKSITRSVGEMGEEVQFTTSEVVTPAWDWKAEEAQNAKNAKFLARFFLALIAGLILATAISFLLN